MDVTYGKKWGLRRLADAQGRFKMVAVDQRPPIEKLVISKKGTCGFADMVAVKRLLAETLSAHTTAVLVDPNFAYAGAIDMIPAQRGLLLTLEDHRFEDTATGRRSFPIRDWTVEKIRKIGGDAVKVLAWYRPDASAEVIRHQQDFVQRIGDECAKWDIPFIFELLLYPFPASAAHTTDYVEDVNKHPEMVVQSVQAFADAKYGVDLFKLESPIPAGKLAPHGNSAESQDQQRWFDAVGEACGGRPWVMLSAGAGMSEFENVLRYAYQAGANGYLAGRAIWWEALQQFPDIERVRAELNGKSSAYVQRLNALTDASATPFNVSPEKQDEIQEEGDFARLYA